MENFFKHLLAFIIFLTLPLVLFAQTQTVTSTPLPTKNIQQTTTLPSTNKKSATRLWNLQNADILSVINEVSRETGKNFIVDPRVQGKVTIVSSKPMEPAEVYQVFLAVLQTLGYSAIPSGDVIKIIPDAEAKQQETPLADNKNPGKGDELVVRVIPVRNVPADQFVSLLRPLLPSSSELSAYSPSNTLIISGRAAKINRLVKIIEQMDSADNNAIVLVPLRHATAADVVSVLNSLQTGARYPGQPLQLSLAADERTNSVLVRGDPENRSRIKMLITQLDKPIINTNNRGNTQVIYLRYLKAKQLVPILRGIALGTTGEASDTTTNNTAATKKTLEKEGPVRSGPVTSSPPFFGGSTSTASLSSEKKIQIQAEPNTNAVIISAPPAIMQSLKAVIAQLDIRPAQVLVEAIIVEISESKLQQLGIEWGTPAEPDTAAAGDTFSTLTGGLGIGFINTGDIRVMISALASDSTSNILATPSLVVLDNQKANIQVGKKVPTVTGQFSSSDTGGSAVNPFTTSDYKDVVLKLEVTPQINQGRAIRLKIKQGNDTLSQQTGVSNNPIFNTAVINTEVMVNSGQILVLGGLLNNDFEGGNTKVPILSSIPLVGVAFQSKQNTFDKKNLVVFLRPVILYNSMLTDEITHKKYEFIREEQLKRRKHGDHYLTPYDANPVLPPHSQSSELPPPFSG